MANDKTVHTRNPGANRYRDLQVYYEKGGTNYWDYSQKPRGIYFASHQYRREGGVLSWTSGQKGDGYLLATPLAVYSAKALRLVRERVEANAERIHDILDGRAGTLAELQAIVTGTPVTDLRAEQAAA
jgi:hypothetical protein